MYQVDDSIVLLADEYTRYSIHKMKFNFDKGMEINMEIDRLFEEEKPEKVEKIAKEISKSLYEIDKSIVDISLKYLSVALKNLGYGIEEIKQFLIKTQETFLYDKHENIVKVLDEIEPELDENILFRELMKDGYITGFGRVRIKK